MKTLIVNTTSNTEIVINTKESRSEQFRQVAAAGCDLGRTSFVYLMTGKVETAKGWVVKTVEDAPAKKVMPLGLDLLAAKTSIVKKASTQARNAGTRNRRDMAKVFEAARKGEHAEWLAAMEAQGFNLCDVQKDSRWFCINYPSQEVGRSHKRVDISPLKNGNFNLSVYANGKATGIKASIKAEEVTTAKILEVALQLGAN